MLFHVTLVHDGAHCPGFHPELRPKLFEALEKREELAKRHSVKIHSLLSAAPEHVEFLIAEAQTPFAVAMFLSELYPFELSQIDVKAVISVEEMESVGRQMFGR